MNEPKRPGRPAGSTLSTEGKTLRLNTTITPEDHEYLLSINPIIAIAIRQIIRNHRRSRKGIAK